MVLSSDSMDSELREELKDLSWLLGLGPAAALLDCWPRPLLLPELADLPRAEGRGRCDWKLPGLEAVTLLSPPPRLPQTAAPE